MTSTLKLLTQSDKPMFMSMDNGIKDDYIARIFDRLVTSDSHTLYGLFYQGKLVSTAGYSLFAEGTYAMLGRFRSDRKYRGRGFVTEILHHVVAELENDPAIRWIGANTETKNLRARRVLEKIGMTPSDPLRYNVVPRAELEKLPEAAHAWTEISPDSEKMRWIRTLHPSGRLFPFECYYPFPLSGNLLREFPLQKARMFLSPDERRYLLMREDIKGETYTNVIYPFADAGSDRDVLNLVKKEIQNNPGHYGAWFNQHYSDTLLPFSVDSRGEWVLYEK